MKLEQYASKFGVVAPSSSRQSNDQLADVLRATFISLQNEIKKDSMAASNLERQLEIQKEGQKLVKQVADEIMSMMQRQTQTLVDAYQEMNAKLANFQIEIPNPVDEKALTKSVQGFADKSTKAVVESIKLHDTTMKDIKKLLAKPPVMPNIEMPEIELPEPVTEWEFNVVRDDRGYMQRIDAKAKN